MKNFAFAAFACTVVLTSACAHAAPAANICAAGTKVVVISLPVQGSPYPEELPPDTGAYGESTIQTWDLSGATGKKFDATCYPHETGFKDGTPGDIPAGSQSCSFDSISGIFNCTR